jgi:proline iminopeptidase
MPRRIDNAMSGDDQVTARESFTRVGRARLFTREIGSGPPIIVVHGGPDFDHAYLLPELDRLARRARLVYYDQRGRGRSANGVKPQDVTIASDVADLDEITQAIGAEAVTVLGHSWGGLLAMEYAVHHPDRVARLILLDTAPASHADWTSLRDRLRAVRAPGEVERMREIAASEAFRAGDIGVEAEYHLIHFRPTVRNAELLAWIVERLRLHFDPAGVLLARAIEGRLYEETSDLPGYDLLPLLAALDTPALLLHGEHDFISVDLAAHIADAMPRATLSVLPGVGHFAFVERPDLVEDEIARFLQA